VIFCDLPLLYGIILGITIYSLFLLLHYIFFKKLTQKFCNQYLSKTVIPECPLDRLIGETATIELVEGVKIIRLEGDLTVIENSSSFEEGKLVKVIDFREGLAVVSEK
jgi:hypothetical protein